MFHINLYNTYNLAKEMFSKPKLNWTFCRWVNNPCIPVCNRHPEIKLYTSWSDIKINRDGWKVSYTWSEQGKKNHPILSYIFKRPIYRVPSWLRFAIYNYDLTWKLKYNDYRYEYPPCFAIVIFGWSLTFWLSVPDEVHKEDAKNGYWTSEDDYWETLLEYIEYRNKFPAKITQISGVYKSDDQSYNVVRPEFFKKPYRKYYKTK